MRSARLTRDHRPAVVLVAHGSRDPRAAASTEALARAVRRARPEWTVRASYLDHLGPRPLDVLAALPTPPAALPGPHASALPGSWPPDAGPSGLCALDAPHGSRCLCDLDDASPDQPRAVLVPLLLTAAYHGRVDLPAVVREAAGLAIRVTATDVLGPASPLLLAAVSRRLPATALDAVVLAAAGTRDDTARQTVADAASALGQRLGLPSAVSYASGPGPRADEAVSSLRAAGARRVGMAAYFLAPGLLYDASAAAAREAGAVAVAEPLGATPELVRLIGARVEAVLGHTLATAA